MIQTLYAFGVGVLLCATEVAAADFYVDAKTLVPANGSISVPDAPPVRGVGWKSVRGLLASGKVIGGDRIFLRQGLHGPLVVEGAAFSRPILISPAPGQTAQVDSIFVKNSSAIVFDGLKVWATSESAGEQTLVRSGPDTSDLVFRNLDVRANEFAGDYMSWKLADWQNNKRGGILVDGNRMIVVNNRVTGIRHGISSLGNNALVENNLVDGFSGDGIRALGNNLIVRGNRVQNCIKVDANHDDGIQSYTRTGGKAGMGILTNILIENNEILEWASQRGYPLRCRLQGIGFFDGMYDGVVIRNNVIAISAYHGITVAGALNSVIAHNTVIEASGVPGKSPWISVLPHKDGTPSSNVTVASNLVARMMAKTDAAHNILVINNVVVTNANREFTSIANRDFTLRWTALGVDAGGTAFASRTDITGAPRTKGNAPDAGAYESW